MNTSKSPSTLDEATNAAVREAVEASNPAVREAVEAALAAALPKQIAYIEKQQAEARRRKKHYRRDLWTRASQPRPPRNVMSTLLSDPYRWHRRHSFIAAYLQMDDSTRDDQIREMFRYLQDPWNFQDESSEPCKIGSCSGIEYGIDVGRVSPAYFWDEEGHPVLGQGLSYETRCLCRLTKRDDGSWLVAHSKCCPANTTNTSCRNDIGRFIDVGRLFYRKPNQDWKWTTYIVVKSLTEGGLWIIQHPGEYSDQTEPLSGDDDDGKSCAKPFCDGDDDEESYSDDEESYSDDEESDSDDEESVGYVQGDSPGIFGVPGWYRHHEDPTLRYRVLEGVGKISYARLPDSIFSNFVETKATSGFEATRHPSNIISNEEFAFEQQYAGPFAIRLPHVVGPHKV